MSKGKPMGLSKRIRSLMLGVCTVVLACGLMPAFALADDAAVPVDTVRTAIQALSADPTVYTAEDKYAVETIWAAFQSLSADDQAMLDAEESHPDTNQPLGRVLEVALWSVWSYNEIDDSTTLPNGTYNATTTPALWSEYSKGKSTSPRQKPWSVKSVTVVDGKATATITVESNTYPGLWMGGKTYKEATYPDGWNASGTQKTSGYCEFEGVPIDLNSTFYFAGISTSMPVPIAFSLTTEINEPVIPDEEYVELEVINEADGLTADEASVAIEDSSAKLTVDLEGESAGFLYAGTLAQALAVSDDLAGWIEGEVQENGAMRFVIPIAVNATAIPFAIVDSADGGDIAENLHPYLFELDLGAATLALERYDNTFDVAVEVTDGVAPEFSAASTASVRAIGDPNDSMFKCVVTLGMDDEAYDYIEYTSMVEGKLTTAGASLSDGSFLLVLENSAGQKSFSLGEPISMSVHHADSDLWLDRTLTIDLAESVIRIDGTDDGEDVAKALIEALPRDPINIRSDDSDAVAKATAAYDALPSDAQARLDEQNPPLSTVSYGRILENSQWAIDAMTGTDASTSLPEGVYTTDIASTYDYGKSPSSRAKAFTVKSITVKDGKAIATIEHESTTDGIMHVNGREYANNPPVNNKDYRTYDVPIDLNSTMHLVWKAQDSGSSTAGTTVELTNSIDESRTSPDSPLPSDEEGASAEEYKEVINELLEIIKQLQASGASGSSVNPNASTASNSSALAAAAAARTGNATNASTTGAASSPTAQASLGKGSLGSDDLGNITYSGTSNEDAGSAPFAILAGILCAAALGALGFALRFVNREDKN